MKEIYLINHGDCIERVRNEYKNNDLDISKDTIFNYKYVNLVDGTDDVIIVKNYLPYYIYKVGKHETNMDILSKGFTFENTQELNEGDLVVLSKPRSTRYIVKPLQTLEDIAKEFGISENYIMEVNSLTTKRLFIGQILWL